MTAWVIALLAGGATGVFLVALLFKLRVLDQTFDERQERVRRQERCWAARRRTSLR